VARLGTGGCEVTAEILKELREEREKFSRSDKAVMQRLIDSLVRDRTGALLDVEPWRAVGGRTSYRKA